MLLGTDWLKIDYKTLFRLRPDVRIERENDPDCSPGPRFWLAGCAEGNIFGVHADLPKDSHAELESLIAAEPPFTHPATPKYLDRYLSILGRHRPTAHNFSLIYELPQSLPHMNDARLIGRDSEEGRDFVRSLSATGLSAGLFELGFRDVDHFWPLVCRCYRRKDRSDSICSAAIGPRGGARAGDREGFQRARLRFSGDRWLVAAFRASISRSFLQHGP